MVWRLRALAVLAENPGLIPSIHMVAHIHTCKQNTQTPKINKLEKKKREQEAFRKSKRRNTATFWDEKSRFPFPPSHFDN